jgi:hypothetical protein
MATSKSPAGASGKFLKSTPATDAGKSPAVLIDARIEALEDWRGDMLSRLRAVIRRADPEVSEEWKWNVPVWSNRGILCTGETYKQVVKLTFAKGASLGDPSDLFNSSLDGNVRRAIDFREGTEVNEVALTAIVQAAIAFNKGAKWGESARCGLTSRSC